MNINSMLATPKSQAIFGVKTNKKNKEIYTTIEVENGTRT